MSERTWGDVVKEYQEYDEICDRHNLDVEDIEAEVDGSVDAWIRQSDAATVIARLEMQMKVVREWIEAGKSEYDCDPLGYNINLHQYVTSLERAIDNVKS